MSLNLFRTFLSLKTSFLIIFCKKNFGTKSTKSWNMTAAAVRTCETAHVHYHRIVFPRAVFYLSSLKKTLISHFQVLFVLNNFCCYFSHVPRDNKSHLQKESGPKVLSFSWNLALRGREEWHTLRDYRSRSFKLFVFRFLNVNSV